MSASVGHGKQRSLCYDKLLRRNSFQSLNIKDKSVLTSECDEELNGQSATKSMSSRLQCCVIGSSVGKTM